MNSTHTSRRKKLAVSSLLGIVIGIGITAAIGGSVFYLFQTQADLFSTSSNVEVRNLSALRSGDMLTISGNVKNVGSTSITNLYISEITTGNDFMIKSVDAEIIVISKGNETSLVKVPNGSSTVRGEVIGVSNGTKQVSLNGGQTVAFKLKVIQEGNSRPDAISNTVAISDKLNIQFGYTSGQDSLTSDVYNTRIRPG